MSNDLYDIIQKLKSIENDIQRDKEISDMSLQDLKKQIVEVEDVIDDIQKMERENAEMLKNSFTSVDKEVSIQGEKLSNIYFQLNVLEDRIKKLESKSDKVGDNTRNVLINIFMTIFGAVVAYVMGRL